MEDGGNNIGSKDAFRSFKPGPEWKVILLGFFHRESINCLASQNNEFIMIIIIAAKMIN